MKIKPAKSDENDNEITIQKSERDTQDKQNNTWTESNIVLFKCLNVINISNQ